MYFLKSSQLGFRHWQQDDLQLALLLWGNAEVTRFIEGPFNKQQVRDRLVQEMESQRNFGIQY
jgi:hypothetical protein